MDSLTVTFILFGILLFFITIKYVIPKKASRSFPLNKILKYFNLNQTSIKFEVINYINSPFYKKSFSLYLKFLLPSIFYPYYMFYYKIKVNNTDYWIVYKESVRYFNKNNKCEIYSDDIELLQIL